MNIERKKFIEIVGVLAVTVSLLFVGFELRQSNIIAVRETRTEIAKIYYDLGRITLEDPSIALIRTKLRSTGSELTAEQEEQAFGLAMMYVGAWMTINGSVDAGLLPDGVIENYIGTVRDTFSTYPGLSPYVDTYVNGSEKFRHPQSKNWTPSAPG